MSTKNVYTPEELKQVLESHRKWLDTRRRRGGEGERADLQGADLRNADLRNADLRNADLRNADLHNADLRNADLRNAYLQGANLRNANLQGANLRNANLRNADLQGTNLQGAYFQSAGVGLVGHSIVPSKGAFTAYKKVLAYPCGDEAVIELLIPASAARVSPYGSRKCRASEALVVGVASGPVQEEYVSLHDCEFVYRIGEVAKPYKFNDSRTEECTSGIHFFIEAAEAEEYGK